MDTWMCILISVTLGVVVAVVGILCKINERLSKIETIVDKFEHIDRNKLVYDIFATHNITQGIDEKLDDINNDIEGLHVVLKALWNRLFDDRKSTCENCVHAEVCNVKTMWLPGTEMKDTCKHFEIKPKEK